MAQSEDQDGVRTIDVINPINPTMEPVRYPLHYLVHHLMKEDELSSERGDIFSRACSICGKVDPCSLSVGDTCGQLACRECADSITVCPHCVHPCNYAPLLEDEEHSRKCCICLNEEPHQRASECGHSCCIACGIQTVGDGGNSCPLCRTKSSTLVAFIEEVIGTRKREAAEDDEECNGPSLSSTEELSSISLHDRADDAKEDKEADKP